GSAALAAGLVLGTLTLAVGGPAAAQDETPTARRGAEATAPLAVPTPPPLPTRPLQVPEVTTARLAHGLEMLVVPRPELPLVRVDPVLPGGESAQPADQPGVAGAAAYLLQRGTSTRSAQDIAEATEQVGGSLDAGATGDSMTIYATMLSDHTDLAFD